LHAQETYHVNRIDQPLSQDLSKLNTMVELLT